MSAAQMMDGIPLTDETTPMLVGIMNGSYKEAVCLYARHYCGRVDAVSAQIIGLNGTQVWLKSWDSDAAEAEIDKLEYVDAEGLKVVVQTVGECRRTLVEMARVASTALGVEIALPPPAEAVADGEGAGPVLMGELREAPATALASALADVPSKVPGAMLLNTLIDVATVACLNEDAQHPVANVLQLEDETSALQSDPDVDCQLLLNIGFRLPVKVSHIGIQGCSDDETGPQLVKVFQGKPNIGFGEAEDEAPSQVLELTAQDIDTGIPQPLKFVKFQNVTSLQFFVESNRGADVTKIRQLEIYGQAASALDMNDWKVVGKT